jgi:hypothetical protein
MRGATKTV